MSVFQSHDSSCPQAHNPNRSKTLGTAHDAPVSNGWRCKVYITALFFGLVSLLVDSDLAAKDWPQILGPSRDGTAENESVAAWQGKLPIEWSYDCGAGYAGVAVADGRVFVWHREDDRELLDCVNAADGKRLWRQSFDAYYRGGVDPDTGPRCVPVVSQKAVIVHGAGGDLHAVSTENGKTLWTRSLRGDYDADDGYFGAGSTPLVVTDSTAAKSLVVVEVGGRSGAGLVALDFQTGKTVWKTLNSEAAYASPVTMKIDGKFRIAALMRLSLAIIEPASGKVLQEIPFGKRGPTVNAATPLVDGQQVFLTASYGIGCKMLQISSNEYKSLWKNDSVISSQYVTPVKVGSHLYAVTGRDDMGTPGLCCVEWQTGEQAWVNDAFGTAHMIVVGDKIIAQNVDGRLDLLAANPKALTVLASSPLPEGTYRSLPALSDGVVFCRRSKTPQTSQIVAIKLPKK